MERLRELAQMNGVATEFWDWSGQHRFTSALTLLRVLSSLGVPVTRDSTGPDIEDAIQWTKDEPWRHVVPPATVVRVREGGEIHVHVPDGASVQVWVELEDGTRQDCHQMENWEPARVIDGVLTGEATFAFPSTLPLGYHRLGASVEGSDPVYGFLAVVPHRLEPGPFAAGQRYWGVNAQAYSIRSHESWGAGDAVDLADLVTICARGGAGFLLVNPLHATQPVAPLEDSPYLPVSRRWLNVTYIRPEIIPEYAALGKSKRKAIALAQQEAASAKANRGGGINRDASWQAKLSALDIIFTAPRKRYRQAQLDQFIAEGGTQLERFALWSALVEHYGTVSFPDSPSIPPSARERIPFFMWLQWIASEQLSLPNAVASDLHMPVGIMADLAVGVHPQGAEYWAEPDQFASGMSVGAPPDMYSQTGQDWSQPPWNPRALAATGYASFIGVVRTALRIASALRIDHIMGLFRLWWIPRGESAGEGTYVSFDHEAMVGILLLEAQRHDAVVIGEDLGTVEPWVREYLADRGILGTSVLWFEKDSEGKPLPPDQYRSNVLATVNTHDLPPTAGYIEGIHTTLRDQLGLLTDSVAEVREADRAELTDMRNRMIEWGLLGEDDDEAQMIEAFHRYIARTPARLVAMALVDAVGEKQPQNIPGTSQQYPNWRVPLSDAQGNLVWLEDVEDRDDVQHLFAVMREEVG